MAPTGEPTNVEKKKKKAQFPPKRGQVKVKIFRNLMDLVSKVVSKVTRNTKEYELRKDALHFPVAGSRGDIASISCETKIVHC